MSRLFTVPVQSSDSDDRYTPDWVFAGLGERFDLDVAAPEGGVPWIPAARAYSALDDGLAQPWDGFVWCNPPYSNAGPWAHRFIDHHNGVWLGPISVNSAWLQEHLLPAVRLLWLPRAFPFVHPTHTGKYVPVAVMVTGLGDRGEAAVRRLAASNVWPGSLWEAES